MRQVKKFFAALAMGLLAVNTSGFGQSFPVEDRQLYDFYKNIPIDYSVKSHVEQGVARSGSVRAQRPDHVNNQATNFFPPIFNQSGGSCGSCANVAYMLCYEINALRNQDGKHNEQYQFPSHFTWLTCSNSCLEQTMAISNGIPNVTVYGGRTYSRYFGLQDTEEKDVGWMQGYDKWYSAMFNRARSMGKFQHGLDTPEGIELAKDWLWNHCGDNDFQAGGVFVIGVAAGPEFTLFPQTAANQEAGVIGHHYVTTWGPQYNHALTVVGYDDRVEFDLDSNGVVGEKEKGETGAWIIANSWGTGWCDEGTIYCPYAYTYCVGLSGDAWDPAFYHPRKNFRPLRTIKLTMDYSRRPEVCLNAGIATDTTATEPEFGTSFAHFNYTGSGKSGSNDIPMLGRWADGYHYEPMELGYDLTDLTDNFDRTKPLKYFFYITTKYAASGKGNIYKASIIDYEFDRDGVEIPFRIDTVAILNRGKTTMISVVVPGEQTYKPLNLALNDHVLTWQAPEASMLKLKGYRIYNNQTLVGEVNATTLSYEINDAVEGSYSVTAVYDYHGLDNESAKSNTVYQIRSIASKANTVLSLDNTALFVPNAIENQLQNATIEFWINPNTLTSYNQQLGSGWGTFLFHTTGGGNIYVGWSTGSDRITSGGRLLNVGVWTHVAITIQRNVMTLYVNGEKKNTLTSNSYSGLAPIQNFMIGDGFYKFDGKIDELRIWGCCRTQDEIKANMRTPIVNPATQTDLLTYLSMDKITDGEHNLIADFGGGHDVDLGSDGKWSFVEDETFLTGSGSVSAVNFEFSSDNTLSGQGVEATPKLTLNVDRIEWRAPGSNTPQTSVTKPTFVFEKPGTYEITLVAYDRDGQSVEATKSITISEPAAPVADFDITNDNVPAGDKVSLVNRSQGEACSYEWSMPMANIESAATTNASVSYVETGSHPITLTVTNSAGSSTITKYVNIRNTLPAVAFDIAPATIVLGQKVTLTDQTRYEPTKWLWTVSNSRHNTAINGQTYDFEPKAPGVYDVSLSATNEVGTSVKVQNKAIFVSNADSENGLNFSGNGERVTFKSPVDKNAKQFTIDYWLFPYNVEGAANLSNDNGLMTMQTDAKGSTTLAINGKSASSGEGYVVPNEWHHYAVTYKSGTVVFYRDGEKFVQASSRLALTTPAWPGNMTLGGTDVSFAGMIDEFKFWNSALSVEELQATCNAPIANPDSMKTHGGLVIYYDFNQSSGNVNCPIDADYQGTRLGFGPDGDAWTSSFGVFTLDFTNKIEEVNIAPQVLTNYKAPFIHSDEKVNTTNYITRFFALQTETPESAWVVENTISDGSTTTGAHVDTYFNSALLCNTGDHGFANSINDQRTYQTVTLPQGRYRLKITPYSYIFSESGSYLVVNKGDTLVGNESLDKAIAYSMLNDKELQFDINEEECQVSLGFIFNMTNSRTVAIEEIALMQTPYEFIDATDITAVDDIADADENESFVVESGALKCVKDGPLNIVSVDGKLLFNGYQKSGAKHTLAKGLYIINGKKVEIR